MGDDPDESDPDESEAIESSERAVGCTEPEILGRAMIDGFDQNEAMNFAHGKGDRRDRNDLEMRLVRGENWLVAVAERFSSSFPEEEFKRYTDFVDVQGKVVKAQARTRIISFTRRSERGAAKFVLKTYLNPHLSGILTYGQRSLAEREYRNLLHCVKLGVPAVEPAAFGERRVFPGIVRSCFLISRFCERATDLRIWLNARRETLTEDDSEARRVLQTLGTRMRRLHEHRFFLHTPNLRNILLHQDMDESDSDLRLKFLDIPFARTISNDARATAAQARDIGAIFGPFLRQVDADVIAPFYESYLPDPIGEADGELQQRVAYAARVHNNATFVSSLRQRTHRAWMRFVRSFQRP